MLVALLSLLHVLVGLTTAVPLDQSADQVDGPVDLEPRQRGGNRGGRTRTRATAAAATSALPAPPATSAAGVTSAVTPAVSAPADPAGTSPTGSVDAPGKSLIPLFSITLISVLMLQSERQPRPEPPLLRARPQEIPPRPEVAQAQRVPEADRSVLGGIAPTTPPTSPPIKQQVCNGGTIGNLSHRSTRSSNSSQWCGAKETSQTWRLKWPIGHLTRNMS